MLQGAMASSERIFALLDTPVEIQPSVAGAASAGGARRHRVRACDLLRTWRGTRCCGTCRSRRARSARGHRGRHRCGQDDDRQPAAAVLRRAGGPDHDRRRRYSRDGSRAPAGDVRPGAAGRASLLRHHREQRQARQRGDQRRGRFVRRSTPCTPTRSSTGCPLGLGHAGGGARCDALGRAEAVAVVRAGAGVQSAQCSSWTRPRRAWIRIPSC